MKALLVVSFFMLAGLLPAASGAAATPAPVTQALTTRVPAAAATGAVPAWKQKWDKTLAAAKKEGVVRVYTSWTPDVRAGVGKGFADRYGIHVDFVVGQSNVIASKMLVERTAGMFLADVLGNGGPTAALLKRQGLVGVGSGSIEHYLLIPEVISPDSWRLGRLPFWDTDRSTILMMFSAQRYVSYNTQFVKSEEIANYNDLLKPQYKGKIGMQDPRVTGAGNAFISHLAYYVWDQKKTEKFVEALVRQEPAVLRDKRLLVESLARGKYIIGLGADQASVASFLKAGSLISTVMDQEEGVFVGSGGGAISVSAKPANPNATTVFVNWLLGKEGQTIFSKAFGSPSYRRDVSVEGIDPIFLAQPGEKAYLQTEDYNLFQAKMLPWINKMFGP